MKTAREIIENYDGPDVRIMEVCGTHTHEIFRLGIRKLLPKQVELISGPGCPVCVTPVSFIDEAIYLALEKGVTICTFGDLVRVPGTNMSLAGAREQGAKIHVVVHAMRYDTQGIDIQTTIRLIQDRQFRLQHRHLEDLVPLFLSTGETFVHATAG